MAPPTMQHYDPAAAMKPGLENSVSSPGTSCAKTALIVKVVCRALTLAMTFISLIVLTTNQIGPDFKFHDIQAYRYMLFTVLFALVYSLIQTAFSVVHLTTRKPVNDILVHLDFYGDIAVIYALATGAAAGFGVTLELQRFDQSGSELTRVFFENANVVASLLFISSACNVLTLDLSRKFMF